MSVTFYLENWSEDRSLPTVEMGNSTASSIFSCLNEPSSSYGEWTLSQLKEKVQPAIMTALNSEKTMANNAVDGHREGRFISFGVPADRIKRQLNQIAEIVKKAISQKSGIYWG